MYVSAKHKPDIRLKWSIAAEKSNVKFANKDQLSQMKWMRNMKIIFFSTNFYLQR